MHKPILFLLVLFSACTLPAEKEARKVSVKQDTTVFQTNDANTAAIDTSTVIPAAPVQKAKNPSGIYRAVLPLQNKMEQTVLFNSDLTYQLQEKYLGEKKDSVVITTGNWTPSDGYIWLYKDQVVRGRYKWKGDTLQYYSPLVKKSFSMHPLQDATQNEAWRNKPKQGIVAFGIGNEPFWSVEYTAKDTISFLLSDWPQPVKMKMTSNFNTNDSVGYVAQTDSSQIRVTIFPQFCSDGMSDFTYRNKIRVQYNHQTYNGCGVLFNN